MNDAKPGPRAVPRLVEDAGDDPADQPIDLSLIISTRDRAASLRQALDAVLAASHPDRFEVVLVDNGSGDQTRAVARAFAAQAPFPVQIKVEQRPGLSRARNMGVSAARGEILVFTDDDCFIAADHLVDVHRAFAEYPVSFLGGRIVLHDDRDAEVALNLDETFRYFLPGSAIEVGAIQGANMAFRREVFEAVGNFDERLGAGTLYRCEDIDMAARALAGGFRGAHVPDLVVRHAHGRRPEEVHLHTADNDIGRGAFYAVQLLADRPGYGRMWARTFGDNIQRGARRALAVCAREGVGAISYAIGRR